MKSVFAFLCDIVRCCQQESIFAGEYSLEGRHLRPETFLDYDVKAKNFILDIWIEDGPSIFERRPGGESFTLGVEFCVLDGWSVSANYREVRRLNLNACGYLARVLSDASFPGGGE
jgi:hypothetical protein